MVRSSSDLELFLQLSHDNDATKLANSTTVAYAVNRKVSLM